ncbi:MAG: cytochrome d ubiquinol oxidase subunit II [Verrucomicrobiota bacterium]
MDLNTIWFILVGILFTGYVMLDGFDLGVGILHLFNKDDQDRRLCMNAIGPVWDGNEVWLVTGGGALFAAFPEVYATVFSGFYVPFMLLLFGLIFRAVSIEFRSKLKFKIWRQTWDRAFAGGSFLSAFLIGVAMGNITWGIPLDRQFEYTGGLLTLIHPYSVFLGITTVALFAMHGNIYLILKTEGELQARLRRWIKITIPIYVICFLIFNFWTIYACEHIESAIAERGPILTVLAVLSVLAVGAIPREIHKGRESRAFFFSCLQMAFLMMLFGVGVYPNMVFSSPDAANSLTIYNGSSTDKTLHFMLWVALIGVPIVLTYTACVYYIFRGKVKLNDESY